MYNDDYRDPNRLGNRPYEPNELISARGNGVYYTLAALVVIVLAVGGLIFAGGGVPHQELATAPDRSHVSTPATPPAAPRLPSTAPDAAPGAPATAPAPAMPKQ
jgi:hypothetical protein